MSIATAASHVAPGRLVSPSMLGEEEFLEVGYRLIELVGAHLDRVRERPPYRPVPEEARRALAHQPLPEDGIAPKALLALFEELVQPFPTFGIGHPRGFGWISGGADPLAVLGSLLSAALNPNCIGGDQSATYLEIAVLRWLKELVAFPTEQEVRTLGLGQIVSGLARSAMAAQLIRKEALEALLADAGEDAAARAAVILACKGHPDARWWLLHKRGYGVSPAAHWASALGEEVNRAMPVR